MKIFYLGAWVSGIIAVILMLFGIIDFLIEAKLFGVNHTPYFFQAANSFLLLAILLKLFEKFDKKETA